MFRKIEQDNIYCFIIQQIDNKSLIYVFESFRQHFLQFSLPPLTKLHIHVLQNLCYVRLTNINTNIDRIWTVLQFVD